MDNQVLIDSICSGFSDDGNFDDVEKLCNKTFEETVNIVFSVLYSLTNIKISKLRLLFTLIDEINSEYPDYLDKNFVISCLVYGHWHDIFHKYFDEIGIDEFFDKIFINLENEISPSDFESLYSTLNENGISLSDESLENMLNQMNYDDDENNHPLLNCLQKIYNSSTKIPPQIILENVPGENRLKYLDSLVKYKHLKLNPIPSLDEIKNLFYSFDLNTKNDSFDKVIHFYDTMSVLPLTDMCKVSCPTKKINSSLKCNDHDCHNDDGENSHDCICEDAQSIIFKYYGPVNTHNECCPDYGGCRMLSCSKYEEVDDDDDECEYETLDWFTGQCLVCDTKIEKRCYSVRFARGDGGWSGCYCSTDCVKILTMTKKEEKLNLLIETQLNTCCIFDSQ